MIRLASGHIARGQANVTVVQVVRLGNDERQYADLFDIVLQCQTDQYTGHVALHRMRTMRTGSLKLKKDTRFNAVRIKERRTLRNSRIAGFNHKERMVDI